LPGRARERFRSASGPSREGSFIDLVPLPSPGDRDEAGQRWRDELIAAVDRPELKRFRERSDGLGTAQREDFAVPTVGLAGQLSKRPGIGNVIGRARTASRCGESLARTRCLSTWRGFGVSGSKR